MKSKPYKLLILFIILISNSLIYGCTNKNATKTVPLSPVIIPEVEEIPNEEENNSEI